MNTDITAQGWFSLGERVPYDHRAKRMLRESDEKIINMDHRASRRDTDDVAFVVNSPSFARTGKHNIICFWINEHILYPLDSGQIRPVTINGVRIAPLTIQCPFCRARFVTLVPSETRALDC